MVSDVADLHTEVLQHAAQRDSIMHRKTSHCPINDWKKTSHRYVIPQIFHSVIFIDNTYENTH